jgi:HK97 family phage major capsid protein
MDTNQEIRRLLEEQGDAWKDFAGRNDQRFGVLEEHARIQEKQMEELAKTQNRVKFAGGAPTSAAPLEHVLDTKTGKLLPLLSHTDKLSDLEPATYQSATGNKAMPSIGRFMRGLVLGGKAHDAAELAEERKSLSIGADPTGGYTVAGALSNEWIDATRSKMVLSNAGCRMLPMDTTQLSLAKIVTSPTISWHGENAALPAGDPTFGAVILNAKTCVCVCKLSLELSQDSANIEQILQQTIIGSMAQAIDQAGLVGVTTDAGGAPSGVMNLAKRAKVTSIGAPTTWDWLGDGRYALALNNVPFENIGALVGHPAIWRKMRKLKTGITSDNTPLPMPAEVAALPKLWTTAATFNGTNTASGVIANWRDLIMGVRKDITVRVLSESFMGSNLQVAILAYARVDFAATRQESFCTLEGITVA